jgi:hypothetical protein
MTDHKPYYIQKLDDRRILVFGKDYSRIEEHFSLIAKDLRSKKFEGEIIFDLLLSNGNNRSRFCKAFFDGKALVLQTFKKTPSLENAVILKVNSIIRKHKEILSQGVLNQSDLDVLMNSIS